jgi:hypothetical protein
MPSTVMLAILVAIVVGVFVEVTLRSSGVLVGFAFGAVFLLGRVLPRMTTAAWSIGAEGEEATASYLDHLAADGYVVMHDLRRSMSTANIDHVVIGPTGVFVIETKNIKGTLRIDGEDVFIGGRRVRIVDEVRKEVQAVWNALGSMLEDKGIRVQALICAHRADLPWFRRTVAGIRVVTPRRLTAAITSGPVVLLPQDIAELRMLAVKMLPPRLERPGSSSTS